ncbi:unnamed protein product [Rotaria magnacalcarata]|uniref:Costars domain-containing protein n=1 Tax=Rotaria magnacalcarata TaxID=392030 RepID=A0A819BZQ7_9BILA|nr:unnamed protein product [Rotaria magnacalcarata]CAF1312240.1 unnamed protein product [Rotaria magnacalcarata]CAF1918048.1 unnamed protein product [Rotaria magnacalcarata]CAF1986845.1 unnamed protein product [Rotaria magnacalcarata]CAF2134418.1 unnamed protein product [Rotaria magnacalcarata]
MLPTAPPLPNYLLNSYSVNTQAQPYRLYKKDDPEYGRPLKGSRTEQRGLAAQVHIQQEVKYLCETIKNLGQKTDNSSTTSKYEITFKQLFDFYVNISNKLVGILLRARKHGYIHFPDECEVLFQGIHDHVKITLLRMPSD